MVNNKKQDDHKYGAMRYIANTLGIQLEDTNVSDTIDQPMSELRKNKHGERQHSNVDARMNCVIIRICRKNLLQNQLFSGL